MYLSLLRPRVFIQPRLYFEAKLYYKLRLLQLLNADPIPEAAMERYPDLKCNSLSHDRELNLEEYFAQAAPPLTVAENNSFWVKLLHIVNSVAKIHSLSNSGGNGHGERHIW